MSTEQKKKSSEESGLQEKNSVYDFLYHDVNRIGSFLAQFDPYGHLKNLVRSMSTTETANSTTNCNASIAVPMFGEAGLSGDLGTEQTSLDGSSMTYDPLWQNSLAFLDYLHQKNMINNNILESRISQFVLVSGKLFLFNMNVLQELSKGKLVKQLMLLGAQRSGGTKNDADLGIEIIGKLPGSIQAIFFGADFSIWSTLLSKGLSISVDDLVLKHGPYISGDWNILGILDAMPDDNGELPDDFTFSPFQKGLISFTSDIRPHYGRPSNSYGMTPLLIFREVSNG